MNTGKIRGLYRSGIPAASKSMVAQSFLKELTLRQAHSRDSGSVGCVGQKRSVLTIRPNSIKQALRSRSFGVILRDKVALLLRNLLEQLFLFGG